MFAVIRHIMKKEVLQTMRDRRMFAILFVAPMIQVIVFGYAINMDIKDQPVIIADLDRTQSSRALTAALTNDDGFRVVEQVDTHAAAEDAIFNGEAVLALLIPRGFETDLTQGGAELLVVMDGSDSNTALRAGQEATQILTQRAVAMQQGRVAQMLAGRGLASDALLPQLGIEARAWYNPQLRTVVYFVPALFGLVLTLITMLLTSMGLTREKELGTLEQVMVTPVRPVELMVGKTLPFALFGLFDVGFIIALASILFDITIQGSFWALLAVSAVFLMTTLGMGLFISTVSATQQQAMLTTFFVILPAIMLSGYVYPIENMPEPAQWLTFANPLRYYIQLTRGIVVKGAALTDLWSQTVLLAVLGFVVLLGAASRFQKRIT